MRRSRGPRGRTTAVRALSLVAGSLLAVGTATALTTAATSTPPSPPPPPAAARVGGKPVPPRGSHLVGAVPGATTIDATVTLRPSNAVALAAYATSVSTPGNAAYRQYLTVPQFARAFGPSTSAIAAVRRTLTSQGLHPGAVSANHLSITIHGSAAELSSAFATTFNRYTLRDGRSAYANTSAPRLAASIADTVQGVVGLDNLVLAHRNGRPASTSTPPSAVGSRPHVVTGGPQPCAAAQAQASAGGSLTADQIATAYNFSPLYQAGDLGAGQTIAMYELETNSSSDIAAYQNCYGTSASVTYSKVDGGATGNDGEATLDIENAVSIAPKAAQIVYQGPNSDNGAFDTYNAIISENKASVISTSWGVCEEAYPDSSYVQAENTLFQEAAAQGQSIFDASGDDGSDDCGDNTLSADDPGGQPFVTVVGGTTLSSYDPRTETAWKNESGSSGGGISRFFAMPSYQYNAMTSVHVIGPDASGTPCGSAAGSYCRQEPDVSLLADPNTGFVTYFKGAWSGDSGGTSGAAPIWAAYAALVNASTPCGGVDIGFVNPELYAIAGTAYAANFHDITTGDNDVHGTGDYGTRAGYDLVTGLGTMDGAPLAASLCRNTSAFAIGGATFGYYGAHSAVIGRLTDVSSGAALAGETVSLLRRTPPSASFVRLTTVTTDSTGSASVSVPLAANAEYEWTYAGTTAHDAATSAVRAITVSQTVVVHVTSSRVKAGALIRIYGTAAPAGNGEVVYLQKQSGSTWRNVTQAQIRNQPLPNGTTTTGYLMGLRPAKGSGLYRVYKQGTGPLRYGISSQFGLTGT